MEQILSLSLSLSLFGPSPVSTLLEPLRVKKSDRNELHLPSGLQPVGTASSAVVGCKSTSSNLFWKAAPPLYCCQVVLLLPLSQKMVVFSPLVTSSDFRRLLKSPKVCKAHLFYKTSNLTSLNLVLSPRCCCKLQLNSA